MRIGINSSSRAAVASSARDSIPCITAARCVRSTSSSSSSSSSSRTGGQVTFVSATSGAQRVQRGARPTRLTAVATEGASAAPAGPIMQPSGSMIATSVMGTSVDEFIKEITEACASGADIIELRLDFIKDFDTERDLKRIMDACPLPYIVTCRANWEGGNYEGPEAERLATLKYAAILGAPYIDVEFLAAPYFFASAGEVPITCKVILSNHDFKATPDAAELKAKAKAMLAAGADIIKIATMANDITDAAAVLSLLTEPVGPTIALAMGEKGVITRLLAAKYGGVLTFAARGGKSSAPGQPDIQQLRELFNYHKQGKDTKLFGIIGNPVSHSRSPLIHNTAFQNIGFDGVYVPLLVDDLARFLEAFDQKHDFVGFSVTIPHKEAALKLTSKVDPVAEQIGAVNTLIRGEDGKYTGYNTDWLAAISAIERKMASRPGTDSSSGESPLRGKKMVIIGAGGAARALAFGAASKGCEVIIANRNRERAEQLVAAMAAMGAKASVVDMEALRRGEVSGDVLANSTSVGMHPKEDESPVPSSVTAQFGLVFDAVYTPLWTRLLLDAKDAGVDTVDGLQMFVGQAVEQFGHFTQGAVAPVALMEEVVLNGLGGKK